MLPRHPFRFFIFVSKPFLWWAILASIVVILAAIVGQSLPLFFKWITEAVEQGNVKSAMWLGLLFPAVVFGEGLLWRLSGVLGMLWSNGVRRYTNDVLLEYTLGHGHNYFSNRFAGSILNKMRNIIGGMESFVHDWLWSILSVLVSIIVTLYYLITVDVRLGVSFVAFLFVLVWINILLIPEKRRRSTIQANLSSKISGRVADMLGNSTVIRQYVGTERELQAANVMSKEWYKSMNHSWIYSEWTQLVNGALLFIFFSGSIFLLLQNWHGDIGGASNVIFVIALISTLAGRLTFVGRLMTNFARTLGEVSEGLDEIVVPRDVLDRPEAKKLEIRQGAIEFSEVTFVYNQNPVFENFSLTIPAGQRVGLVGSSGAGKSTFVSLLLRQFDIHGGVIEIDGQNITSVTQDSLRTVISVVPQEPSLFHRTIRENITYGNPAATNEEVIEVAKKAHAHDFVDLLPEGYDTMVGERGVKLSGGQKPRIAIARAMLKDAPVLVLDEATSALDSESEVEIQKALHTLMVGKTVIAIAHRLSTLREMDRIVVLDQGKIIEDGTHDSLIAYNGKYAALWQHQAGGFLEDVAVGEA